MSLRSVALCFFLHVLVSSALAALSVSPPKFGRAHGKNRHGLLKHGHQHESQAAKHAQSHKAHETHTVKHVQSRKTHTADPEPPRMFVAEGCDGSTAIMIHAIKILAMYGINGGDPDAQKELLDPKRNHYYTEGGKDIVEAMMDTQKAHRDQGETLVFKSILHRDLEATVSKELVNMGTMAVYVTRKNLLDQLVCMVRDCFLETDSSTTKWGYPVDENGQPSNLCFDRRNTTDKEEKAMLKVEEPVRSGKHNHSNLMENLNFLEKQASTGYKLLQKAGYNAPQIAYEDLIAFEVGDANNVQISLKAWTQMLEAWGVQADNAKLRQYFVAQGTWKMPSQQHSIYNYGAVVAQLKKIGRTDQIRD